MCVIELLVIKQYYYTENKIDKYKKKEIVIYTGQRSADLSYYITTIKLQHAAWHFSNHYPDEVTAEVLMQVTKSVLRRM